MCCRDRRCAGRIDRFGDRYDGDEDEKETNSKTSTNRSKTTTIRGNAAKTSATTRTAKQMAKGAAGASKPPKTVARPSGGTKMGGERAGGKGGKGC